MIPDPVAPGEVLDLEVGELRVRDGDDGAVERAHPRRAQPHLFDGADRPPETTELPDAHRLVGVERDAADEVLQRLLRRQRDGDPAHAQPRQHGDDVDAETVEHCKAGEDGDEDLRRLPGHGQQGKQREPAARRRWFRAISSTDSATRRVVHASAMISRICSRTVNMRSRVTEGCNGRRARARKSTMSSSRTGPSMNVLSIDASSFCRRRTAGARGW